MAYGRRKAWENRTLAIAIANMLMFAEATVGGDRRGGERRAGHRWLSADALLAEMGVKF